MMRNVLAKNTQLVTENSELHMHMSFMPVEYRDYVKSMQSSNHQEYRKQRVAPKVIVPNTDHKEGIVDIELEDAPMSHPSVQHLFRDAQYSTIGEARQLLDKGFALRQRQIREPYKLETPWRVELPPPAAPAPEPAPDARHRTNKNGCLHMNNLIVKAYHQVMSSANTEPYAVPTSQCPPPLQQQAIRPARLSLDYRRADQPPLALIEDPSPMKESSSEPTMPNPDLPADHWRNGGKGKRPPPQHANRHPQKYARSDGRSYPPSRTPQTSEPVIPLPPNAQKPALKLKISSLPKLTPGDAGVPLYKEDEYQPLTRKECKSYYSLRETKNLPKVGEPLLDEELIAALTKIPDEGDLYINDNDRTMSQFVMDRLDQCFLIPDDFVYEVMVNGIRKFRTIHGEPVQPRVAFASTSLYQLLDMKMIARVGTTTIVFECGPRRKPPRSSISLTRDTPTRT
jgi:hypothetical protein